MTEMSKKQTRRIFIKETIGTRKYFSYRADIALLKVLASIAVFIMLYFMTSQIFISAIMSVQIFILLTLVNSMVLGRKEREGREALIGRAKREWFIKKIKTMDASYFEDLIIYFFGKEGFTDIMKRDKGCYLAQKDGKTYLIKACKLYDEAEIERIDVRSMVTEMMAEGITAGYLASINKLSESAIKEIDKLKNRLTLSVMDADELFELSCKYALLPEDSTFCRRVCNEKSLRSRGGIIKENVFSYGKTGTYILSGLMFFIMSIVMPGNGTAKLIGCYFAFLATACIGVRLWNRYRN